MLRGKTVIVDIDGTIADCNHRLHYITSSTQKKWHEFHSEALYDDVHNDVVFVVKALHAAGMKVVICTARNESNYELTKQWLDEKSGLKGIYEKIYMRASEDLRDDHLMKIDLLKQMIEDGYHPVIAFDDRNSVVNAFRKAGLRVLQVTDSDY